MDSFHNRVARGAALLDEKVPDWRSKVKVDLLDQELSSFCVLGQVFGNYYTGTQELGLSASSYDAREAQAAHYGFNARNREGYESANREMTKLWKLEVSRTRPTAAGNHSQYSEATLLSLLDAGVTVEEFTAYIKVQKILSNI